MKLTVITEKKPTSVFKITFRGTQKIWQELQL